MLFSHPLPGFLCALCGEVSFPKSPGDPAKGPWGQAGACSTLGDWVGNQGDQQLQRLPSDHERGRLGAGVDGPGQGRGGHRLAAGLGAGHSGAEGRRQRVRRGLRHGLRPLHLPSPGGQPGRGRLCCLPGKGRPAPGLQLPGAGPPGCHARGFPAGRWRAGPGSHGLRPGLGLRARHGAGLLRAAAAPRTAPGPRPAAGSRPAGRGGCGPHPVRVRLPEPPRTQAGRLPRGPAHLCPRGALLRRRPPPQRCPGGHPAGTGRRGGRCLLPGPHRRADRGGPAGQRRVHHRRGPGGVSGPRGRTHLHRGGGPPGVDRAPRRWRRAAAGDPPHPGPGCFSLTALRQPALPPPAGPGRQAGLHRPHGLPGGCAPRRGLPEPAHPGPGGCPLRSHRSPKGHSHEHPGGGPDGGPGHGLGHHPLRHPRCRGQRGLQLLHHEPALRVQVGRGGCRLPAQRQHRLLLLHRGPGELLRRHRQHPEPVRPWQAARQQHGAGAGDRRRRSRAAGGYPWRAHHPHHPGECAAGHPGSRR